MNTLPPYFDATRATSAALPAGLQTKLLAAMQQAADEEHEFRKVEQVLHRMRPAELSSRLVGRLGVQMYLTAQQKRHSGHWRAWLRGGAAAAALALCVGSGALLLPGSAVAEGNDQGLVGRNVIDSRSTGKVVWRRGEAPVRHYQVIYEDSFVLEEDDTTTVIRVPNTTEVEVEEDYL